MNRRRTLSLVAQDPPVRPPSFTSSIFTLTNDEQDFEFDELKDFALTNRQEQRSIHVNLAWFQPWGIVLFFDLDEANSRSTWQSSARHLLLSDALRSHSLHACLPSLASTAFPSFVNLATSLSPSGFQQRSHRCCAHSSPRCVSSGTCHTFQFGTGLHRSADRLDHHWSASWISHSVS